MTDEEFVRQKYLQAVPHHWGGWRDGEEGWNIKINTTIGSGETESAAWSDAAAKIRAAAPALPEVELRVCRKCSHQIEALVQMCPSGGLCSSDESIAPPDDEDAIIGQPIVWNLSFDVNKNEYTDEGQNYYVASEIGETIRQLTELLREYESSHDHLRQKCSICIKAGELLKEPA